MSEEVLSIETLLLAVIMRYGWDDPTVPGRRLTITRDDLEQATRQSGGRRPHLALAELPTEVLAIRVVQDR